MSIDRIHQDWWESFCRQHEKSENEMKALLFNGELSKKESRHLVQSSCFADLVIWDRGFVYYIDYSNLFKSSPQLIDRCNWDMLDDMGWRDLLIEQPQFADKCDKWHCFDVYIWRYLLKHQPQFANKFKFNNLSVSEFNNLSDRERIAILIALPHNADKCNWRKIPPQAWLDLLRERPEFADKCNKWSKFDARMWEWLLIKQPQFADKCEKWKDFPPHLWRSLFSAQPQLADKCDRWDEFDGEKWSLLLREQPQFADKCDKWHDFNGNNWSCLLEKQPQFADKCNKWYEFDSFDWRRLLEKQPQFADKCDWSKLDSLDTYYWSELLQDQPQFADKCNKWDEFDEDEKEELLDAQPQLAKYFNDKNDK